MSGACMNLDISSQMKSSVLSRRAFLLIAALGGAGPALPVWAQEDVETEPDEPAAPASRPFSFDWLVEEMRALAATDYVQPERLGEPYSELDYDTYRRIAFKSANARWRKTGLRFQALPHFPGWLFREPVGLFEVVDGRAEPMVFNTRDFRFHDETVAALDTGGPLPGVAGIRINHPLNRPDIFDETVSFLGASYFRALGAGNAYGASARGLAINTGTGGDEEFPRFTNFWLERPQEGRDEAVVFASLDSPSVAGAYRFVLRPGDPTVIDVTTRLFLRADVPTLGVAPLTSMFLYADANRHDFDDYRPRVHDSDGLLIERANGETLWRALANPPRLGRSFFSEPGLKSFGLYQRARDFDDYQDVGARYEDRPSVRVEPLGQWPSGSVNLVEIPTDTEANDNIVALWTPDEQPRAGDEISFDYRMSWGAFGTATSNSLAIVRATRAGVGGFAGVEQENENLRKFVIDFAGGAIAAMDEKAELEPVVTSTHVDPQNVVLLKVPDSDIWRLTFDIDAENEPVLELTAHISGYGSKQSEIWLYQWIRNND